MSEYIPQVSEELLAGFLDEAPEYLEILDEGLMAFESKAEQDAISLDDPEDQRRMTEMFRAAHSFKGLGAAMGFDKIRDLTHLMETLFDQIRMGKRSLKPNVIETLFGVFDNLKALVAELSEPPAEPVTIEASCAALQSILDVEEDESSSDKAPQEDAGTPSNVAETPASAAVAIVAAPVVAPTPPPAAAQDSSSLSILDNSELLGLFVETTIETIDEFVEALLKMEERPDDADLINQVFRCAHNIKGATGAAGCDPMYRLTHTMETMLDRVRHGKLSIDDTRMALLLKAADALRADVDAVSNGDSSNAACADLVGEFTEKAAIDSECDATPDESTDVEDAAQVEDTPMTNNSQEFPSAQVPDGGDPVHVIVVRFPKDFIEAEIQAYLIFNKLSSCGTVLRPFRTSRTSTAPSRLSRSSTT